MSSEKMADPSTLSEDELLSWALDEARKSTAGQAAEAALEALKSGDFAEAAAYARIALEAAVAESELPPEAARAVSALLDGDMERAAAEAVRALAKEGAEHAGINPDAVDVGEDLLAGRITVGRAAEEGIAFGVESETGRSGGAAVRDVFAGDAEKAVQHGLEAGAERLLADHGLPPELVDVFENLVSGDTDKALAGLEEAARNAGVDPALFDAVVDAVNGDFGGAHLAADKFIEGARLGGLIDDETAEFAHKVLDGEIEADQAALALTETALDTVGAGGIVSNVTDIADGDYAQGALGAAGTAAGTLLLGPAGAILGDLGGGVVGDALDAIGVNDAVEVIGEGIGDGAEALGDWATQARDDFIEDPFGTLEESAQDVLGAGSDAVDAVEDLGEGALTLVPVALEGLGDGVAAAVDTVGEVASDAVDTVGEVASDAVDTAGEVVGDVGEGISDGVDAVGDFFGF